VNYADLGHLIKCNPAIKTASDKHTLIDAVANSERLDIIGTDHAPHTWQEKQQTYFNAPSGLPLVQHALPTLLELVADQKLSIETLVRKTSHQVADLFRIKDRGYIREGYWADLVLIRENQQKQSVAEQTNYMRYVITVVNGKISQIQTENLNK
jgi:dihydroorotase